MSTYAIYPGSFNPWHQGHTDILKKALACFDNIIISIGINPEKELPMEIEKRAKRIQKDIDQHLGYSHGVLVELFEGLLVDYVAHRMGICTPGHKISAVIRGLRNGHDLQYEMNQQYWNEDLGLQVPIVYFICDRTLSHISSSMIRTVKKIGQ